MVSVPGEASVLHPEQVAFWELLQRRGKAFYPEVVFSATVSDDFTPEQYEKIDASCIEGSLAITEVAKLLGVLVDTWQEQVVAFTGRSSLHNFAYDKTDEARCASETTLGQFVVDAAFASVPVEGQIDGDTQGIWLSLRTEGKLCLSIASENNVWYPDYEEHTDVNGNTVEGEQIGAGGYSFRINVSLHKPLSADELSNRP